MPVTGKILEVAEADPDRLAIVGDSGRLSYGGLVADGRRVRAAVERLHTAQAGSAPTPAPEAQGIPITAVSIADAYHAGRILAGLAGFRAVSATIDPRWPLEHRVGVITAVGIGLVISDSAELREALAAAGWAGTILPLEEFLALERETEPAAPASVRPAEEPFLLLFSSGTTSAPKAFIRTRGEYRYNAGVSSRYLEAEAGVATLAPGPLSYSLTLFALVECLFSGGTCHLADRFDPLDASRRIAAERISRIVAVPAVLPALAEAAKRDPERFEPLELVVTGGANLSGGIRANFTAVLPRVRLINYYGAAEIGFIGDSRDGDGTRIALYEGVEAEIRDASGRRLPEGEVGSLWIRVASTASGYVAATTDVELRDADGWASVHDQGRLVGGGLDLVGRAGDILVTGGHKVFLPDVERAFSFLGGAESCCAVGVPHERLGSLVALVIEGAGHPDKSALLAHARAHLPPQAVPRRWYRIDALPRTVGGKIRRAETAELVRDGAAPLVRL
ncbi:fatty acid--CoA ligase family protein [Gulosibacter sp. 10]|uniref:ANL family adenylate-forming protein n=1 Tax=Gulosibacter sp. 10 TaxID=1255570 RepID=UPI00097EF9A5|nr:fatty acid--CoA ligase family protein [Gulosibacter sp. 10]SJM50837.1 Long-chain-fatty-acid--CoA ligase [Gulosibacter sp. 10]